MTIRQRIHAEIDAMDDEMLDVLDHILRDIAASRRQPQLSIFDKIKQIRIDGPPDLSDKHDEYAGRGGVH